MRGPFSGTHPDLGLPWSHIYEQESEEGIWGIRINAQFVNNETSDFEI